jgi:hypothetical protein
MNYMTYIQRILEIQDLMEKYFVLYSANFNEIRGDSISL